MIRNLYIKDFALIDELDIGFEPGLNVLTGQTGAGKSIIIGALNMILGERADTDVIRTGAKKAVVEATIAITGQKETIRKLLAENAVEWQEDLIIRREIRSSGSRAFINDTPVTLNILKAAGNYLVDLHGQHDHQLLLKPEHHRRMIDGFGAISELLEQYRAQFQNVSAARKELKDLKKRENELQEQLELYRFQLNELEEAELDADELQQIQEEMKRLDNAEELDQTAGTIVEYGTNGEVNAMELLQTIQQSVEEMAQMDDEFSSFVDEIESARISLQEMIQFTESYRGKIEFNPQRLEELRRRISEIRRLQKKYQRDVEELIAYRDHIAGEVNLADNLDFELNKARQKVERETEKLQKLAVQLHDKRLAVGKEVSSEVVDELAKLGMPHSQLELHVDWLKSANGWLEIDGEQVECTLDGADHVEFFISTNPGESLKPLAKVASGGEISRIMLALKSVLAREQSLPVMIFDEIDSGISGKISEKVGRIMRRLATQCQIICITHQPQIASYANTHFQVLKEEQKQRMVSLIRKLEEEEHVEEIASLMSGETVTNASLASARELIDRAKGS